MCVCTGGVSGDGPAGGGTAWCGAAISGVTRGKAAAARRTHDRTCRSPGDFLSRRVVVAGARTGAHGPHAPARPGVPLTRAAGLTPAEQLCTGQALPAFDTAAMDAYAVAGPGPWLMSADAVRAGAVEAPGELAAGEAVEISTGAQVPRGAEAVLPLEHAVRSGATVRGPAPAPGKHIRRAGEDAAAGPCLAPAGTRTGPALLALLTVAPEADVRDALDSLLHTYLGGGHG
ncbi:MoeA family protein [Streptomyces avermitilis]|uniref:hypothetical protein n=1 Tax=Streptomyces avermitilis TaxID=33903 RepID=UPI003684100A